MFRHGLDPDVIGFGDRVKQELTVIARGRRPTGKRLGIVTGGGGLGVLAADKCAKEGLEVVSFTDKTLDKIGGIA